MAKGGLGRGLGALLPNTGIRSNGTVHKIEPANNNAAEGTGKPKEISLTDIRVNPHQPRLLFNEAALAELTESIKQYGVLQPIIVRKVGNGYELIAGERRMRAARQAGLLTIPAIFREYNDIQMTEVALIENIQRENLNPIEEARAYHHLMKNYGLTQESLSVKVGRSRSHIANFMRLLKLVLPVQDMLSDGSITMGQAKPLIAMEDGELQEKAAKYIVENELSARKCEQLVKQLMKNPHMLDDVKKEQGEKDIVSELTYVQEAQDRLKQYLGADVRIKTAGKKKRIEIDVVDENELQRVLAVLTNIDK